MNRNIEIRDKKIEEKHNFGSYNTEIFLQYLEIQGKLPFYKP